MNRSLKVMIGALALTTLFVSAKTNKVYAGENSSSYLSDISLSKSDDQLNFIQDVYRYTVYVDKDANDIKVKAKPKSEEASVMIDDLYVNADENYKREVELEDGSNLINIEVNDGDEKTRTYTVNVIKGKCNNDEIYLNKLVLNGQDIELSKDKQIYDLNVTYPTAKLSLQTVPEDNNYEVMVDGGVSNECDNYIQDIELKEGLNPIVIKVRNLKKDYEREYILNITRDNQFKNKIVQDNINLFDLKCSDAEIKFNPNQTIYNVNVKYNTDRTYIKADPEKIFYKVKINDKVIEEMDDYQDFIKLHNGLNEINIVIQDKKNNKQKQYKLNIYR